MRLAARAVKPTMAFMGVRMSWDMLERKALLAAFALLAWVEGLFQKGPLLHLFAGLDIDAAQAEDDVVSHAPIAVAHDGGLVVLGVSPRRMR